jgi:hypothetical protein
MEPAASDKKPRSASNVAVLPSATISARNRSSTLSSSVNAQRRS